MFFMSEDPNRRHSAPVVLRFEPEHLELIDKAAEGAALNRSAWIRSTLLRVAREELGEKESGKGKGKRPSP
jgi:uncharacterized protein (DUF1778 family)